MSGRKGSTLPTDTAYEMMKQREGEGGGRGEGGGKGREGGEKDTGEEEGEGGQGSDMFKYDLVEFFPGNVTPIAVAADEMYEIPFPPSWTSRPLPTILLSVAPPTGEDVGVAIEGKEEGVYDNIPGNQ